MKLNDLVILVRGAGEIASATAHRLHQCHFKVCLTEIAEPMAVRRGVAFCEAVFDGEKEVEGVTAKLIMHPSEIAQVWHEGKIPMLIDPEARIKQSLKPDVIIDGIMAKKNMGTRLNDAPQVIGLGVGFRAGMDVHTVIETKRGHNLGKVIHSGESVPDTGVPGEIAGYSIERVLRAPQAGRLTVKQDIYDSVQGGQVVATVGDVLIRASIPGVIRGMLRDGTTVYQGMKIGDIDPRNIKEYCDAISDKSRAIAGGVLEAVLAKFNM